MAKTRRAQRVKSVQNRRPELPCQGSLILRNRQRNRRLDMRLLRRIVQALLAREWSKGSFDLGIYVVTKAEITHLNEAFLRHKGPTYVISFDYSAGLASPTVAADVSRRIPSATKTAPTHVGGYLHGEVVVCLDEAVAQARRFRTTWQSELVRYVVHGVLHLLGYDDQASRLRREMKRAEDSLVRELAGRFDFRRLSPGRASTP
jgi:probable rRNA maturation factor